MDINEIRALKIIAECKMIKAVQDAIDDLQESTGETVDGIDVTLHRVDGTDGVATVIAEVYIDVSV